jgi:diaminopimelate epimerase
MAVEFTKMHGCGNDFIMVDAIRAPAPTNPEALAIAINDRRFGVGGDGLILIERGNAQFRMRMFNPDGSESEMCGNGIRCFAKYARDRGLTDLEVMPVETGAGLLQLSFVGEDVRVDMGVARLLRGDIPMQGDPQEAAKGFAFEAAGQKFVGTAVSMGNPHCVVVVEDVDSIPLEVWGPAISVHPLFPRGINAHFLQILSPTDLKQRTWERGAGATLACGTGASASLVAAYTNGLAERKATVHLPGGNLVIEYIEDGTVFMTGPAVTVFDGVWNN